MLALFSLCLSVFNTVFRGYIIKTFWIWFILTQFPNLPRLETVAAIGLSFFVSAMSPWKNATGKEISEALDDKDNEFNKYTGVLNGVGHFVGGLFLLGCGWLLHHFFM